MPLWKAGWIRDMYILSPADNWARCGKGTLLTSSVTSTPQLSQALGWVLGMDSN